MIGWIRQRKTISVSSCRTPTNSAVGSICHERSTATTDFTKQRSRRQRFNHKWTPMNTNQGDQIRVDSCVFVVRNLNQSSGFSLVIALVMVALMAVITVGVITTVSLERGTATSYSGRYQADLAAQNGLQAASKTLAASPNGTNSVTGKDTFLVVRADGPADANGNKAAYYYLAQPAPAPSSNITYYPLFSASTDPSDPLPGQTPPTINLAAAGAP